MGQNLEEKKEKSKVINYCVASVFDVLTLNHDIHPGRLQQYGTTTPMHLTLQHRLKRQFPNMHGQHPVATIGPRITFSNVVGLILGDHACVGVMALP